MRLRQALLALVLPALCVPGAVSACSPATLEGHYEWALLHADGELEPLLTGPRQLAMPGCGLTPDAELVEAGASRTVAWGDGGVIAVETRRSQDGGFSRATVLGFGGYPSDIALSGGVVRVLDVDGAGDALRYVVSERPLWGPGEWTPVLAVPPNATHASLHGGAVTWLQRGPAGEGAAIVRQDAGGTAVSWSLAQLGLDGWVPAWGVPVTDFALLEPDRPWWVDRVPPGEDRILHLDSGNVTPFDGGWPVAAGDGLLVTSTFDEVRLYHVDGGGARLAHRWPQMPEVGGRGGTAVHADGSTWAVVAPAGADTLLVERFDGTLAAFGRGPGGDGGTPVAVWLAGLAFAVVLCVEVVRDVRRKRSAGR